MSSSGGRPLPRYPNLVVEPWLDPLVDAGGFDPRSEYAERFWLSILGPSTMWLLRHMANRLDRDPEGFTMDLRETARTLGMSVGMGAKAPFIRSIDRSCRFGAARFVGPGSLSVRRLLPPLNSSLTTKLPNHLRREHRSWLQDASCRPSGQEIRSRARQLAMTLFQLGEDLPTVEHQLQRWRFHPAVVHEAARWAQERLRSSTGSDEGA